MPILRNILLSFQDVTAMNLVQGERGFVGLANYIDIFKDSVFRTS